MYGLVVELEIDEAQADRAIEFLHNVAVPMISQGSEFVSGTWMRSRDGRRTRSVISTQPSKRPRRPQSEPDRALRQAPQHGSSPPRCLK